MSTLLKPKMDFVFKKIFGNENHPNILISFLNAVFAEDTVKSVEIKNTDIEREHLEGKLSRLDIKAVTDKNEHINIEIQLKDERNMVARSLYYWSKMYSSQLENKGKYENLERTVCINILNFNYTDSKDYHSTYVLKEKYTNKVITDKIELHFIELPKAGHFGCKQETNSMLDTWITFIKEPESNLILEMEKEVPEIQEAKEELTKLSLDKKQRELYTIREEALFEVNSLVSNAEYNKALDVARTGIEQGLDVNLLSTLTGLSVEEIKGLE